MIKSILTTLNIQSVSDYYTSTTAEFTYTNSISDHSCIFMTIEVDEKFRHDKWWWVLISEIVNFKKVTNFPIHHNVTNLFIKHPLLIYLFNLMLLLFIIIYYYLIYYLLLIINII